MPFVPLPFVVALMLLVLFGAVAKRDGDKVFLAFILVCAIQSGLLGLRWGYGVRASHWIMPLMAALMPPLIFGATSRLTQTRREEPTRRWVGYVWPVVLVALVVLFWPEAIDATLIALQLGYAGALLWKMRAGADTLRLTPFETATPAFRAILFSAFALCFTAFVDAMVQFDIEWGSAALTPAIVSIANLIGLFLVAAAAAAASRRVEPSNIVDSPAQDPPDEDREIIARIDALMQGKKLYQDNNLTLDRLARKAGLPARRISTSINRVKGVNVSQYVNGHRIGEACQLLETTDQSVTEIMLSVGFQTKSNFNREFRRVTDMNPVSWRMHRAEN